MLVPVRTTAFKRDVKRLSKGGYPMDSLKTVILLLLEEQPVPPQYRDHALKGNKKGFRELHLAPDWLLIYKVADGSLYLTRTGTHTELLD